jgi:phage baseplate assembly protein gpV
MQVRLEFAASAVENSPALQSAHVVSLPDPKTFEYEPATHFLHVSGLIAPTVVL